MKMVLAFIFLIEFILIFFFMWFYEKRYEAKWMKVLRALLLTLIITVVNYYGSRYGLAGILIAWLVNLISVKFILNFNFLKSFLFIIGLGAVNQLIAFIIGKLL